MNEYKTPVYFLSDCHLPLIVKHGQEDWTPRVLRFLREEACKANTLFLVGDLFDFWFEWKRSVPSATFKVLAELHNMVNSGKRVIYLGGNHDGHVGRFLTEEAGIEVHRKPVVAEIENKRFYILHGDGVAPSDHGYRMLRALVRWKPTEAIYRLVHPDFGIWFAHKVSRFSRYSGGMLFDGDENPYLDFGRKILDKGNDFVVMGHMHKAAEIRTEGGGFFAIGDWIESGSYGVFEDGKFSIRYYK